MTEKRFFFPPQSRALVGIGIALVVSGLAALQAASVRGPLDTLAWFERNRGPGDSAAYASALYHAGHAQRSYAGRWGPTGYLTLGTMGAALGIGLALTALRRDR